MTTPILGLDEWEPGQAQPHVPVNTALRILEALSPLTIIDRDLTTPPAASDGDCYIVPSGASGDWEDHENDVAIYIGGAWFFKTPRDGWQAWVIDEQARVQFSEYASPPAWDVLT